jgi:hypothetical protein
MRAKILVDKTKVLIDLLFSIVNIGCIEEVGESPHADRPCSDGEIVGVKIEVPR